MPIGERPVAHETIAGRPRAAAAVKRTVWLYVTSRGRIVTGGVVRELERLGVLCNCRIDVSVAENAKSDECRILS